MSEISVIVPVYKVEPYLRECVDSILAQSFPDFELILVDDGSPDTCPQICDAYARQDPRVTVIHKPNGGLSDARNTGIDRAVSHSESRWLAFVDSDDYIHPDYLRVLYETARAEDADLVICNFRAVNVDGDPLETDADFFSLVTEDKTELFACMNKSWRVDMAWNKLYSKSIFDGLRFERGKIHEDEFAIHQVLWKCRRAAFVNRSLYYYRIRKNSIMATPSPKSRLDKMEALVCQYEFSLQHRVKPRDLLFSNSYIQEITDLRHSVNVQELPRYRQLFRRYKKCFWSNPGNRTAKGLLRYGTRVKGREAVRFLSRLKRRLKGGKSHE